MPTPPADRIDLGFTLTKRTPQSIAARDLLIAAGNFAAALENRTDPTRLAPHWLMDVGEDGAIEMDTWEHVCVARGPDGTSTLVTRSVVGSDAHQGCPLCGTPTPPKPRVGSIVADILANRI